MRDLNNIKIDSKRLKWIIKNSNLTQSKLAQEIDMNKDYLNQRIRDGFMNEYTLNKICSYLNVSPSYVTGEDTETISDVFRLFPSESAMDSDMRSLMSKQVDPDGHIVFSYNQYSYKKNHDDKETQIKDFLRSLVIHAQYIDYDDKFHEVTRIINDETILNIITLRIKKCIHDSLKELMFDYDPDDNSIKIDAFGYNTDLD